MTGPSGSATMTSKHARKTIDNRRNSAISPKNQESSKVLASVALAHKSALDPKNNMNAGQVKTSRADRDRMIKQTPQRDDKMLKKKSTVAGKTGSSNNNPLANSRCRSKLSIGSSQTQNTHTQPITQK